MSTGRVPATGSSPLTTKGDLYTYSTTQARLAVGNNGETLVADSSASVGLSYRADWAAGKNKLINGDFYWNQRAFTSTTTNATYGFDRWRLNASDGTSTYSAETFTLGAAPVAGYEGKNFARLVSTGQTATSALTALEQRIESVRTFAGQTVTISLWAKASTGTPNIAVYVAQVFGSGGSPSTSVLTGTTKQAITTSWARYSFTIAVPSISGKTLGTDGTDRLGVSLVTSAGTDRNTETNSLGIQSTTIDFWGVQIEAGSVATAFQTATGTLAGELAACQRYFYRTTGQASTSNDLATGWANSTTNAICIMTHPVTMRIAPTATLSAQTDFYFTWSLGTSTITASQVDRTSPNSAYFRVVTSGLTTGEGGVVGVLTGTAKYIEMSAEL